MSSARFHQVVAMGAVFAMCACGSEGETGAEAASSCANLVQWHDTEYAGIAPTYSDRLPGRNSQYEVEQVGCGAATRRTVAGLDGLAPETALASRAGDTLYLPTRTQALYVLASHPLHLAFYKRADLPQVTRQACDSPQSFRGRLVPPKSGYADRAMLRTRSGRQLSLRINYRTQVYGGGAAPALRASERVKVTAARCGRRWLLVREMTLER